MGQRLLAIGYKALSPFAGVQLQFSIKKMLPAVVHCSKGLQLPANCINGNLLLTRYTDLPTVCPAVKLNCKKTVQSIVNVFSLKVRK